MLVCSNTVIARPNTSSVTTFHSPLTLETAQLTRVCTECFEILLKSLIIASSLLEHCLEWLKLFRGVASVYVLLLVVLKRRQKAMC